MNSRRLTTALFAALIISGGCTLLLGRKMLHHNGRAIVWRRYVAATRPIRPGDVLKAGDLTLMNWAPNQTLQGGFSKAQDVVGRAAIYPIEAGQPVVDKDLASAGAGLGITTRIPDGMRAVALKSDDVVGVAGFVYPGSYVDVLVTYRTDRSPEPITATVLQDAQVLAIGHQTQPKDDGKPETVNVVTLLLTPDNAERVVLASTQGTIHFVLRNSADRQHLTAAPALLSQFGSAQPTAAGAPHHFVALAAPKPKPYVVETVLGDKSTKVEF